MFTIATGLAALLLSAGDAQGQSLEGFYEVQCTTNEVRVSIRGSHLGLPIQPSAGTVYLDSFILPTDCEGRITEQQLEDLYAEIMRDCRVSSPGVIENCLQIADDVTMRVGRIGSLPPIQGIAISDQVVDPERPDRARLSVLFEGERIRDWEIRIGEEDQFRTRIRRRRPRELPNTTMDCTESVRAGVRGRIRPQRGARLEYLREHNLDCRTTGIPDIYWRNVDVEILLVSNAADLSHQEVIP